MTPSVSVVSFGLLDAQTSEKMTRDSKLRRIGPRANRRSGPGTAGHARFLTVLFWFDLRVTREPGTVDKGFADPYSIGELTECMHFPVLSHIAADSS